MVTKDLQELILAVLKQGHHVSTGQLMGLLDAEQTAKNGTHVLVKRSTLSSVLSHMARRGLIEKTIEREPDCVRYRMPPPPRYGFYSEGRSYWVKRDGEPWVMTEAEARVCVTALNELERKVRQIKS